MNPNLSALTDPLDPRDVEAFTQETRASGNDWRPKKEQSRLGTTLMLVFMLFVIPGIVIVGAVIALVIGLSNLGAGFSFGPVKVATMALIFPAVGVVVMQTISRRSARSYGWDTFYRLSRFAWDNGLEYRPSSPRPSYPGMLFASGASGEVYNHLSSVDGRYVDIGNFQFEVGKENDRPMYASHGFIAINLERRLPHIVLQTTGRGGVFARNPMFALNGNVVSLEGDFDRFFTLHCPPGYERDALYVLTPDLMALLIDETARFDVELVDNWMFVYSSSEFDVTDPTVMTHLLRIVDTVGERAVLRSSRYRDERVGSFTANTVAPAGRRVPLRAAGAGVALLAVIVVALVTNVALPDTYSFSFESTVTIEP